jgi:hypothetical protein
MENSLYYTFSTVAQSLAALMGLLGALALFRLQSIENDLRSRGATISRAFLGHKEITDALAHEDFSGFLSAFDEHLTTVTVTFAAYEQANINRFRALVPQRSSITSSLKWSFGVTALTMVFAVYVLTIVHNIKGYEQLTLYFGVLLFSMCLALQSVLVLRLLK